MSTSGSCASLGPEDAVADVADVAAVAGGGAGAWLEHAAPYTTAPHTTARKVLFISAFLHERPTTIRAAEAQRARRNSSFRKCMSLCPPCLSSPYVTIPQTR